MLTDLLSRAGLRSRHHAFKAALWLLGKVYEAESRQAGRISAKLDQFNYGEVAEYDHLVFQAMEEELEFSEYTLDCLMAVLDELEMVC